MILACSVLCRQHGPFLFEDILLAAVSLHSDILHTTYVTYLSFEMQIHATTVINATTNNSL